MRIPGYVVRFIKNTCIFPKGICYFYGEKEVGDREDQRSIPNNRFDGKNDRIL